MRREGGERFPRGRGAPSAGRYTLYIHTPCLTVGWAHQRSRHVVHDSHVRYTHYSVYRMASVSSLTGERSLARSLARGI